jgi:hypothetical protein
MEDMDLLGRVRQMARCPLTELVLLGKSQKRSISSILHSSIVKPFQSKKEERVAGKSFKPLVCPMNLMSLPAFLKNGKRQKHIKLITKSAVY